METWVSLDPAKQAATVATIRKHGLAVGMLIGGREPEVAAHYATFAAQLPVALAAKPVYVNCHTGRDWFDTAQNRRFFDLTHEAARRSGIPVRPRNTSVPCLVLRFGCEGVSAAGSVRCD